MAVPWDELNHSPRNVQQFSSVWMYRYSVIARIFWVLGGIGVKIASFDKKIEWILHICTLLPLESWVLTENNSLVVVVIPEWWLLPTTTDQCSYNTIGYHPLFLICAFNIMLVKLKNNNNILCRTICYYTSTFLFPQVCTECEPERQFIRLFDVTEQTSLRRHKTHRTCHKCGEGLRDTIVHFGEKGVVDKPLNWAGAVDAVEDADAILCLGSSLKVGETD